MLLLHGDCLEQMKQIEDHSVDLIFCDLPYGQTSCKWDCKIDLSKFWIEIMRVKKVHTPIFFTTTTKFGVDLINSAPKKCRFRYDLVWIKSSSTSFLLSKKMPMKKHEMIYVFYEKLPLYDLSSHTHKLMRSVPIAEKRTGKVGVDNKGMIKNNCKSGMETITKYDPPLPTSTLEINSIKSKKHSTEKPIALMEWILKYYSKEGDIILDPTMGSGSTGVACKNLNRNFIGIELDEDIYQIATSRLEL